MSTNTVRLTLCQIYARKLNEIEFLTWPIAEAVVVGWGWWKGGSRLPGRSSLQQLLDPHPLSRPPQSPHSDSTTQDQDQPSGLCVCVSELTSTLHFEVLIILRLKHHVKQYQVVHDKHTHAINVSADSTPLESPRLHFHHEPVTRLVALPHPPHRYAF